MFEFKLSKELVEKILTNLKKHGIPIPLAYTEAVEAHRLIWGQRLVGQIGIYAQRTRHAAHAEVAEGVAAEQFYFIKDGHFPKEIGDHLGGVIPIPAEDDLGDKLMEELAQEFLAWAKVHAADLKLHPEAPVTHLSVEGESVVVHVSPYEEPEGERDFVCATVLE